MEMLLYTCQKCMQLQKKSLWIKRNGSVYRRITMALQDCTRLQEMEKSCEREERKIKFKKL